MTQRVLAAAMLVVATSAPAAPPQEQPAGQATQQAAQAERKICRTEKATGSLTRRTRICLTAAQWREVHDRTRRGVGDLQGDASGSQVCQYEDPNRTSPCY